MTALNTFVEEARELLGQLEAGLAQPGPDAIGALFRAAHTLKGAAGIFGFDEVVRVAHAAEALLEVVRSGERPLDDEVGARLLEAHDELARLVDELAAGGPRTAGSASTVSALLALAGQASAPASPTTAPGEHGPTTRWAVRVEFGATVMTDGFDPISFFRYLEKLGPVSARSCDVSRAPAGDAFDPECCYLTVFATVETARPRADLEKVFEFIAETSRVELTAERPADARAGESRSGATRERPSVKVPADRLDLLIDLVGELVIAQAVASAKVGRAAEASTHEAMGAVTALVASIRDSALGLRMVPIAETFARFGRVVRDVSKQLGKDVALELSGGETELDKAVVERLVDPLTHLVRNSLDHGLETIEGRRAAGKPTTGTLRLAARHEGGSILIEVKDDGRGLNRQRILARAIERGLVSPTATLRDDELDQLIFLPGFSSAETVTDLSGRGVGMDVVRQTVEALRGTIELTSVEGQGTTLALRLPLTLAIIDGFVVTAGDDTCVLPLKTVVECLDFETVVESERHHRLNVRGAPVPFVRLREFFGRGSRPTREAVVVVQHGEQRVGLVVDQLLGTSQTVVKPLGPLMQLEGVAGATILGSGGVGYILDVAQVIKRATAPRGAHA